MQSHVMYLSIAVETAIMDVCGPPHSADQDRYALESRKATRGVARSWDREVVAVLRELRLTARTVSPPAESEPETGTGIVRS